MEISELHKVFKDSSGISTDTRSISNGNLFFALSGPNFNANTFAKKALELGAIAAVVDHPDFALDNRYILVEDSLQSLQQLASYHRQQLDCTIIAVCGSNGKTTSKELIARVLSSTYNTFFTPGNFNNHIGVPLSLLMLSEEHEYAVIEMGANHKGEHEILCQIATPDFGIITNNGKDHLEGFGSIEGVIEANNELFEYLEAAQKAAFVNSNDSILMENSRNIGRILYGSDELAMCDAQLMAAFPYTKVELSFSNKKNPVSVTSQLFGSFQKDNLALAACIGYYFDVEPDKIKAALEAYRPANMRTQQMEWNDNEVLLDAYNANPSSMMAVLKDFSEFNHEHKALILGDMLEMGDASFSEHEAVVDFIEQNTYDLVVLVGTEFARHQRKGMHSFETTALTKDWLLKQDLKGLSILIKGSRGLKLETLLT